jgi:hypothetical protein
VNKPTLESLYRGQLKLRQDLEKQLSLMRLDLQTVLCRQTEITRWALEIARRLIRENDTLRSLIDPTVLEKHFLHPNPKEIEMTKHHHAEKTESKVDIHGVTFEETPQGKAVDICNRLQALIEGVRFGLAGRESADLGRLLVAHEQIREVIPRLPGQAQLAE